MQGGRLVADPHCRQLHILGYVVDSVVRAVRSGLVVDTENLVQKGLLPGEKRHDPNITSYKRGYERPDVPHRDQPDDRRRDRHRDRHGDRRDEPLDEKRALFGDDPGNDRSLCSPC